MAVTSAADGDERCDGPDGDAVWEERGGCWTGLCGEECESMSPTCPSPFFPHLIIQRVPKLTPHPLQQFNRYLPLPLLKTSFSVTNRYVLSKLFLILFPWRHAPWARQVRRRGDIVGGNGNGVGGGVGGGGGGGYDIGGGGGMHHPAAMMDGGNVGGGEGWMPPREDLNAPDLYIPSTYPTLPSFHPCPLPPLHYLRHCH